MDFEVCERSNYVMGRLSEENVKSRSLKDRKKEERDKERGGKGLDLKGFILNKKKVKRKLSEGINLKWKDYEWRPKITGGGPSVQKSKPP